MIRTNMQGPKMLKIECLSQALRIPKSILFELEHFPTYWLKYLSFSCNAWLKGTFLCTGWLKGTVSRTVLVQGTFSRTVWISALARVPSELEHSLMYFLA